MDRNEALAKFNDNAVEVLAVTVDQLTPEAKATSNPAGIRIETSDAIDD